jgi:hypothetical protein
MYSFLPVGFFGFFACHPLYPLFFVKGKAALSPQTLREIDRLKDIDPRPWARLGAWLAYKRLNR